MDKAVMQTTKSRPANKKKKLYNNQLLIFTTKNSELHLFSPHPKQRRSMEGHPFHASQCCRFEICVVVP